MSLEFTGSHHFPPPRAQWLARGREEVLDPDLPIVDAHHHIWEELGNEYRLADLAADCGDGHRVVATVLVEAHAFYREEGPEHLRPVGETEAILQALQSDADLAGKGLCRAIVARADLMLGAAVEEVVQAQRAAARGRLRGIRQTLGRDPHFPEGITICPAPEGLLKRSEFRDGLRALSRLGVSFDAMLYHSQLSDLVETVGLVPELSVVLNHCGTPLGVGPYAGRRDEVFATWTSNIRRLAEAPNVTLKLGGMGMVLTGADWHERPEPPSSAELAAAWHPWFETCIEAFGADRCMFESNFPVDKGMYGYRTLWNAFKRLVAGAGESERAALFHDTAARVYQLKIEESAG